MGKPLHIQLLEYLKQKGAVIDEVDLKDAFILQLQTFEERAEFNKSLRHLHNSGFIYTMSNGIQYGNIDDIEIKAVILPKGETYLKSQVESQLTYNLPNSNNVIIAHSHSSVEDIHQIHNAPINTPTKNDIRSHKNKSRRSAFIIAVGAGILVVLFTVLLKSCGVNA